MGYDPVIPTSIPTTVGPSAPNTRPKLNANPAPNARCTLGNISGNQMEYNANTPFVKNPTSGSSARNNVRLRDGRAAYAYANTASTSDPTKKNAPVVRRDPNARASHGEIRHAAMVPALPKSPANDASFCPAAAVPPSATTRVMTNVGAQ